MLQSICPSTLVFNVDVSHGVLIKYDHSLYDVFLWLQFDMYPQVLPCEVTVYNICHMN